MEIIISEIFFYESTIRIRLEILLKCNGFFSGSETALTASSKARIKRLARDGKKRAKLVERLLRAWNKEQQALEEEKADGGEVSAPGFA